MKEVNGIVMELLVVFMGYLAGSIPFGLVFGRCAGIDVRSAGSGNIGATNVNRLLGKKLGALTLMADAGKAVVPMLAAVWVFKGESNQGLWVAITGGAAFLGHLYPVYLKFKGGKGVATALGVFLYLQPMAALACVLVFSMVVAVWGYVSLGSLAAAITMPLVLWVSGGPSHYVGLSAFICALIWIKHHENIKRLINHQESSIKKR